MTSWNIDSVIFLSFLLINIIIGLYSARGIKNIKEYALGDGKFSSLVIAATLIATWISGSNFMNNLSETYSHGLYYLWAISGMIIYFFIISYLLSPRLGEFIGKLSIADAMGSLYGENIRIFTAIVSCIGAGGFIAAQLNVAGLLIEYTLGISSIYGVLIAAIIVGTYSSLGGVKSVTITDVMQLFTFGTIIPVLAYVIFQSLNNADLMIYTLQHNELFNYKEVFNFTRPKSFDFFLFFLFCCTPSFTPAIFQRVAMARNTLQIKESFSIAGCACCFLVFTMSLIGVFILSKNSNLNAKDILPYILSNYAYVGLKGLILSGVMAMVMSTADSFINSTAVIVIHDLLKPLTLKSRFIKNELFSAKITAIFITLLALTISIIGNKNLLKLVMSTQSFYVPMVSVPFVLAVFGFRTTGKSVLITMFLTLISVIILKIMNYESIHIMFIAILISLFSLFLSHYLLKQPGGWVGIKDPSPLLLLKAERIKKRNQLIENIKNFSMINFLKKSTSHYEYMYVVLSFFCFIILYSMIFTIPKHLSSVYEDVIKIIYSSMTFAITGLLSHPLWPRFIKNSKAIVFVWNFVIFYVLVFGSLFFAIISHFAPMQLILLATNLILVSLLIRWQLFFTMIIIASAIIYQLIKFYLKTDSLIINLNYIEFKISYILMLMAAIIVTFLKPKQEFGDILEQKVQERTRELERALAAKTEFLNNMSHEIRTPIQGFVAISEGLVDHWSNFDEQKKLGLATQISSNAKRLKNLLGHLLDLSKFSAGKMILNFTKIDLNESILAMIDECKALYLIDKNIEFIFEEEKDVKIIADNERIAQVLRNLLINAIKFSANNSKILVKIFKEERMNHLGAREDFIHFSITDFGIGIPEDELEEIFLPFNISSRTKTKAGGTGLGLAIARKIIDAHHGKIWAKNNPDGGSIFHFVLPKANTEEPNGNQRIFDYKKQLVTRETKESNNNNKDNANNNKDNINKYNPKNSEDNKKPIIMIIDDEEACLTSMEMLLYDSDYQLIKVSAGAEALDYLRANSSAVKLIMLDLMMPDIYGLKLLEEFKKDTLLANIPVIMQSGTSDEKELDKCYKMGAISHISKPYEKKIVLEIINKIL